MAALIPILHVKCFRKTSHIFLFFSHALLCVSMRCPSYLLIELLFIFQNPSERKSFYILKKILYSIFYGLEISLLLFLKILFTFYIDHLVFIKCQVQCTYCKPHLEILKSDGFFMFLVFGLFI